MMGKGEKRVRKLKEEHSGGKKYRCEPGARVRAPGVRGRGSGGPEPPPGARASGAARVLAGGAPHGRRQPIREGVRRGAGLASSGSPSPPFCTHTNTKSHTTFGYPFSIFFSSLILCVFSNFLKIEICGSAGVRKLLLREICAFPHFFFSFSSSFFFLVKVLNIPRS